MTTQTRPADWEDPLITGRHRVLTHSPLGAFADAEAARLGNEAASPFRLSLNGIWKFALTDSPAKMPQGFTQPQTDDSAWHPMPVPSNWQLDPEVDDQPIYTNMPYPFKKTPSAPPAVNPTGWYRTTFDVPAGWDGRQVFLLFESCDSACKVWVNGVEVGYSQDSKLPHEFNVTEQVVPGANHLAVMVPRYCDGFYLECQDYWHLSGIQRDVVLYSKPRAHIRDFVVRTTFGADYRDATLFVRATMNDVSDMPDGYSFEIMLYGPDGQPAMPGPEQGAVSLSSPMYTGCDAEYGTALIRVAIESPRKWTAETPDLYRLVLTLKDPHGAAVDFESCRVGFRQVEIRDSLLRINGRRMIVRGVDSHEHHPEKGRALTREDMRAEIAAMKRLNFNAIRTSHYPHHSAYYDLCDELGMYVVDEANLETHGIQAHTTKDPVWMNAYMERAQRMALRDKNHACVVVWSLGNESSHGPHHAGMAAWLRHYDPTRPVQYESGFPGKAISDIMCPMYGRLPWVVEVLSDPAETRPMVLCEYAYSKGNANGNVKKYWDMVDQWPRFQGGFVWDWADKALVKTVNGKKEWAYGNEFDNGIGPDGYNYGEHENPQMCLNGVVGPDLTPKPGAIEMKKVQAPVTFLSTDDEPLLRGEVTVWNQYVALDLSHLEIAWELTENGKVCLDGVLAAPNAAPGERAGLAVPIKLPDAPAPGGEYWLTLKARRTAATPWSEAGHVVAWEQFRLPVRTPARSAPRPIQAPLQFEVTPETFAARGEFFELVFDRQRGALVDYKARGRDLITRPLEHSLIRARTDNDYITGNPGSYYSHWVDAGLDHLRTEVIACTGARLDDTSAVIRCVTHHRAAGKPASVLCAATYTLTGNGEVLVENRVDVDAAVPTLARVGMKLGVAAELETLTWYGRGPHENYPDRKASAWVGKFASTVDAQFFPFVDPCECGGHEDTRHCELSDPTGFGLRVVGEPLIHFSALHYTIEDLTQAGHVYELTRTPDIQLNIDGFHMGLGGDTGWTNNVHPEYLLPPGTYRYAFRLGWKG